MRRILVLLLMLSTFSAVFCYECASRTTSSNSIICVCNATFCGKLDFTIPESVNRMNQGDILMLTSSQDGLRFHKETKRFQSNDTSCPRPCLQTTLTINRAQKYQKIIGYGGAFTDSTGINIASLSQSAQKNLLNSYFSNDGIQYSTCRVPIGGTDFSTRGYTYNDGNAGDFQQEKFQLANEDYQYKIKYITEAQRLSGYKLKLFGTAWSAPAWMKTSNNLRGGLLKGIPAGEYYRSWAVYCLKFLSEYKKNNVKFWGLTLQNEPLVGMLPVEELNSNGFLPGMQRDFVTKHLGPVLNESGYGYVQLICYDEIRMPLLTEWFVITVLSDPIAHRYVSGIGTHIYFDKIAPFFFLSLLHNIYPDKFILSTEGCEGTLGSLEHVSLGNWDRAEYYAHNIIKNTQHWSCGWVDWNMALNELGGPSWINNNVDSPIIVNSSNDEFYLQPMFFSMGHFSKFVRPDSIRIDSEICGLPLLNGKFEAVAFDGPGKVTVVVLLNRMNQQFDLKIIDSEKGAFVITVPKKSIISLVWKSN